MHMFLNGTAMRGQQDHRYLNGAPFLGEVRTAARYRFYAVRSEFPGLVPVETAGGSIVGELYDVDDEVWRTSLGPSEPAELTLGTIELDDGRRVQAMLLDTTVVPPDDLSDITEAGGWRAYLSATGRVGPQARTS